MTPQSSERSQQDEFSTTWPQIPQLHPGSCDAYGIFDGLESDPFADAASRGSNTAISEAHHQYSPTTTRYQHLIPANLTGSDSAAIDTVPHSLLPPFNPRNELEIPDLSHTQNDSIGPCINPGQSSVTTITAAERPNDTSLGASPLLFATQIPTTQRRSRARKPAPEEWERHKRTIEYLYLKQNLSLTETITEMRVTHQFYATEKMYKDMFKQWKWSKNLPRGMAIGVNRRDE